MMDEKLIIVAEDFRRRLIGECLQMDELDKQLLQLINDATTDELLLQLINHADTRDAASETIVDIQELLKAGEALPF